MLIACFVLSLKIAIKLKTQLNCLYVGANIKGMGDKMKRRKKNLSNQ
jgi:hypothetical protein